MMSLYDEIDAATGVKHYTNQQSTSWSYGHARVVLPRFGVSFGGSSALSPQGSVRVRFRREGSDIPLGQTEVENMPYGDVVAFVKGVLSTGRTCEVGKGVGLRSIGYRLPDTGVDIGWRSLALYVREGRDHSGEPNPMNLNPDYQRGPVWDEQRQRRFIGHCLEGGRQQPMYVQRDETYADLTEEVIDGQQRLRAIAAFIYGEIPGEVYHEGQWQELWYRDFNEVDRTSTRLSSRIVYGDWPLEERLRFYLRLNSGGVAHTEEELDRVRALLVAHEGGEE
jgi:hypothetical protein